MKWKYSELEGFFLKHCFSELLFAMLHGGLTFSEVAQLLYEIHVIFSMS